MSPIHEAVEGVAAPVDAYSALGAFFELVALQARAIRERPLATTYACGFTLYVRRELPGGGL